MATAVGGTDEPNPSSIESRGLRLPLVLGALTVVSGLIDAVSYLGLGHVFTANMTGNVVVLGFAAAGAPGFSATHSLVSLGAFLVGSVVGGRCVLRFSEGSRRTWMRTVLACEAVLVGASAVIAYAAPDARGTVFALIAVTAVAMGLRNATVRKLGVADMTTTVLTMALTGLAADSWLGGGKSIHTLRRAGSALALLAGALLGAWLVLNHGLGLPLLVAALIAAALAVTASGRL
ncbi:YoaK family protein [Streptomyces sp. NPDC058001]|uniref:YoaK family protein n=1 Tax=Streptomyces sp. NPDC058001 TaxID=3346300 RepID=UPI0036EC039C